MNDRIQALSDVALNARPEFKLLVCLARTRLTPSDNSTAHSLMREGIDWNYFLALAWKHGLMPLSNKHLLETFADCVPADYLKKVRADFHQNSARCVLLASELCSVLEEFERRGIAAIAYKGPALAAQLYGDLKLRAFVDLDVLIAPADVNRAGEVLVMLGYQPHLQLSQAQEAMLFRSECDRVYVKDGNRILLELHWAVVPPFFSLRLKTKDILAASQRVQLCSSSIRVPTPEMLLLLLCVNGTKDLWCVLERVCAVNELVRSHPELNWKEVERISRDAGAFRMLLAGLDLARKLFNTPLMDHIRHLIEQDRSVANLSSLALLRLTGDKAHQPGFWETSRLRVRAIERRRDKLRYCALRLLTPSFHDCVPALPPSFRFVYYGLRPLRLLRIL
jgi:hypothetical protein